MKDLWNEGMLQIFNYSKFIHSKLNKNAVTRFTLRCIN